MLYQLSHIRLRNLIIERKTLEIKIRFDSMLTQEEHTPWRTRLGIIRGDGMRKIGFIVLILLLTVTIPEIGEAFRPWPEGWSDLSQLFSTSLSSNQIAVLQDESGTSFLTLDGTYFQRLNLVLRNYVNDVLERETVFVEGAELASPILLSGDAGQRHLLWIERSSGSNAIHFGEVQLSSGEFHSDPLWITSNAVQDLAAIRTDAGDLHMVWSERSNAFQIMYGTYKGGVLEVRQLSSTVDASSVRPSLIQDNDGIIHIFWFESSQLGVEVHYAGWDGEEFVGRAVVGRGAVSDIQQGGFIALGNTAEGIAVVWSAAAQGSPSPHLYVSYLRKSGEFSSPKALAVGARPSFVIGSTGDLVWQVGSSDGTDVYYGRLDGEDLDDQVVLSVGKQGAFRPTALLGGDGRTDVYWLQAQEQGGYALYNINNRFPKQLTVWDKVGIDSDYPWAHLVFVVGSNIMLTLVYFLTSLGVTLPGLSAYLLLLRIRTYRNSSLLWQVALCGVLLALIERIGIPGAFPKYFGAVHYGISFGVATLGTYLMAKGGRARGDFAHVLIVLGWMYLFLFFRLLPQSILMS